MLSFKRIVGATIVICLILFIMTRITENAPVDTQNNENYSTTQFSIGDTVILEFGTKKTWAGTSKQNYDELIKYVSANDQYGVSQLLNSNRVFGIDNGTKAILVSAAGFGVKEVRVLDGEYAGTLVYVASESLKSKK